jgi:16S rRNA (cytosine1407-C5)-methyltransferase
MQQITAQINNDFENHFLSIYGERWPMLRESLLLPTTPTPYSHRLLKPYMMDSASVIAASTLKLPENGVILDACAAPGGKSMVLATRMGTESNLVANEFSSARCNRLRMVLDEYLDTATRQRIKITGFDAAKLGRNKTETYNAILLDVPCSSERHVIQDQKALAQWTPSRPRFLSQRQWSLLSAAFLILKDGGSLVYSTCTITPEENDSVVARLLQKYGQQVFVDEPDFTNGEKTNYGRIILPDQCDGMGPMYVARFEKKVI